MRDPTEVGELGGAAVELELVAGEGLEPVLERVLQRPRYDRLHGHPRPSGTLRGSLWGGAGRRGDGSPVAVAVAGVPPDRRRDSGGMERERRGGDRVGVRGEVEGGERKWWALLGSVL